MKLCFFSVLAFFLLEVKGKNHCNEITSLVNTINEAHFNKPLPSKELVKRSIDLSIQALDPWAILFSENELVSIRMNTSLCSGYLQLEELYSHSIKRHLNILDTIQVDYMRFINDSIFLSPLDKKITYQKNLDDLVNKIAKGILYYALIDYTSDSLTSSFDDNWENLKTQAIDYYRCRLEKFSINKDHVFNIYLNAIASSHDPHTNFFDQSLLSEFYNDLSSEIITTGIIADHDLNGDLRVVHIIQGSPAEKNGKIEIGDKITKIKIDQFFRSANCIDIEIVTSFFNSGNNEKVNFIIQKKSGLIKEIQLTKSLVSNDTNNIITAISTSENSNKMGYLKFNSFYVDEFTNVSNDLTNKLLDLNNQNIEGLIIDLRFNGGGDTENTISLIGAFVDFGPIVIGHIKNEKPTTIRDYNRGRLFSNPLIILVNSASASASEIMAVALQQRGDALIVGEKTFGKGTGQEILPVFENKKSESPFGFLKITTTKYYSVGTGSSHQATGIDPDITVKSRIPGELFSETSQDYFLPNDTLTNVYAVSSNSSPLVQLKKKSADRLKSDNHYTDIIKKRDDADSLLKNGFYMRLEPNDFKIDFDSNNSILTFDPDSIIYRAYDIISGESSEEQNQRLIQELSTDHQLNETFNILEDWLSINSLSINSDEK